MQQKEFDLRPVWDAILEVYEDFKTICMRHDIVFYAGFGTALGAVRHHGFIPWDDDFDVEMTRKGFKRFLEVARNELPPYLKIITWRNTPEHGKMYAKIQDTRREVLSRVEHDAGYCQPHGLYIDIFILDGYPARWYGKLKRRIGQIVLKSRYRYLFGRNSQLTIKAKFANALGAILNLFLPRISAIEEFLSINEKRAESVPFEQASLVRWYNVDKCELDCYLRRRVYDHRVWYDFENTSVPLPGEVDEYLRANFGDYMTLPPIDQRKPQHGDMKLAEWRLGPTHPEKDIC